MALPKLFQRIFWHNNTTPAINEDNLNAMSKGLSDVDDRVISLAGTIMEDVPQIQEDIEELEEDFALIDEKIAAATSEANRATTKANEAAASVISAGNKALISEGYAKGTQNGTPVGSSSPYYHNNAEYFKEQARSFTPTGYQDLVDDVAEAQEAITDIEGEKVSSNDAYVLRQCKGNMVDFDLVGGSVAWNQLVANGNFASASGWIADDTAVETISASNNVLTMTVVASATRIAVKSNNLDRTKQVVGHKYLVSATAKSTKAISINLEVLGSQRATAQSTAGNKVFCSSVFNLSSAMPSTGGFSVRLYARLVSGDSFAVGDTVNVENYMVTDLTQLFGSTIADYIYSLEQATAGAGVAWFRQYFSNVYYAYNVGEIKSVNPSARNVVGENLLNPSNIKLGMYTDVNFSQDSSTVYCSAKANLKKGTYTIVFDKNVNLVRQILDGVYTQKDVYNVKKYTFTLVENGWYGISWRDSTSSSSNWDITSSVMIHFSTILNDDIKPYQEYSYNFDTSKQLRGIFKLDANNKMYADGDIYTADGTVTRKYGIVDLGSLSYEYNSTYGIMIAFMPSDAVAPVYDANHYGVCNKYVVNPADISPSNLGDKELAYSTARLTSTSKKLMIKDSSAGTDAATFKTAMSGVYLVYELATPTTESAAPFQNPQRAFTDGTEEFIDAGVTASTRDVSIPVGNKSEYNTSVVLPISQDYTDGAMEILKEIVASSSDFADFKTKVSAL